MMLFMPRKFKSLKPPRWIFYVSLFFLVWLVSYRKLLFVPGNMMIGHNWDWSFPVAGNLLSKTYQFSIYTWFSFNLGSGLFLNISQLLPNLLLSGVAMVLPPLKVVLGLLLVVHLIAFLGFKKMLDDLFAKTELNYWPAFLYAFSPFLFNEVVGGSWYMWISFAIIPFFFIYLYKWIFLGQLKALLGFLISSIFLIPSLQNSVLIEIIFVSIVSLQLLEQGLFDFKQRSFWSIIGRYIGAHILLFLLNLYWIIPFLSSFFSFFNYVSSDTFTSGFQSVYVTTQNILSIFNLSGYLDREIYSALFSELGKITWLMAVFGLWGAVFYRFKSNRFLKKYLAFLIVFLGLVVFTKGHNQPFSRLTMEIFTHFPLFNLYRSPQHLMLAPAFLVPILVSSVFTFKKKYLIFLFGCLVMIWVSGWWWSGNLGINLLREKNKDHIDLYQASSSMNYLVETLEKSKEPIRFLSLPTVMSPYYLDAGWQHSAQGGQIEYSYLQNSTLVAEYQSLANNIDNAFCQNDLDDLDFEMYLALTNVRYVFVRSDVVPAHTDCAIDYSWNQKLALFFMNQNEAFDKVYQGDGGSIFKLKNEWFQARFYVSQGVHVSEKTISNLGQAIKSFRLKLGETIVYYNQNQNLDQNDLEILNNINPNQTRVEIKRINPTRYQLEVFNAPAQFLLVFQENFDPYWQIKLNEQRMPNWKHFKVNNYANGWLIDISSMDRNRAGSVVNQNEDGTYNFELMVEFQPQRLLHFGFIMTGAVIILVPFLLVTWRWFHGRSKKNEKK